MEGLLRYDLVGDSHGWRRPGYETSFESGLVFSHGRSARSIHVPIALVRDRQANPYSDFQGDDTFPDDILPAAHSHTFGPILRQAASAGPEPER